MKGSYYRCKLPMELSGGGASAQGPKARPAAQDSAAAHSRPQSDHAPVFTSEYVRLTADGHGPMQGLCHI